MCERPREARDKAKVRRSKERETKRERETKGIDTETKRGERPREQRMREPRGKVKEWKESLSFRTPCDITEIGRASCRERV